MTPDPYAAAEAGAAEVESAALTGLAAARSTWRLWLALAGWLALVAVALIGVRP